MASSPERSMPSEWADEQVMKVLFSPFRDNRDVNPHSWDSKMKFWTDMISRHCTEKRGVTINARQLPHVFERKGQVPSCLHVVLDDLIRRGAIQRLADYRASVDSSWLSWSFNWFVKKPISWSFNTFVKHPLSWAYNAATDKGQYMGDGQSASIRALPDEEFVVIELAKATAEAIYRRHNESMITSTDNVVGYSALRERCRDICTEAVSFDVGIIELCRRKFCSVIIDTDGEKVIQMVTNQTHSNTLLSENALKIYKLKATRMKLEQMVTNATNEIEQCRLSAKKCLTQGQKSTALKYLKKKKSLEASVIKNEQTVDNINSLLQSIENAESQKQIVDALSSGVAAFKSVTKTAGLTPDKIDTTMSEIQEVFDLNEEINQSVSQRLDPADIVDDDELEQELNDLMFNNTGREKSSRGVASKDPQLVQLSPDILDLPEVPHHNPMADMSTAHTPFRQRNLPLQSNFN